MGQCKERITACKLLSEGSSDIQLKLNNAVGFMEDTFNLNTSRARSCSDCLIVDRTTSRPIMSLNNSQDIIEVSKDEFARIIGYYEGKIAGSYCTNTGKIFLVKDEWCCCNLIHEALHSRSVFSKTYPLPTNLEFVYEGITELMVGFILKRRLPNCFNMWRVLDSCFLEPYLRFVKPWYYLNLHMDFSPITSFYFDIRKSEPYKNLGTLLESIIGPGIGKVFCKYNPDDFSLFDRFIDELSRIFPTDFAEFQSSPLMEIDL